MYLEEIIITYMKKEIKTQIRRGLFETNSSSTHSLTMVEEDVFNKWKKGELLYCDYDEEFKTPAEVAEKLGMSIEEYNQQKREEYDNEGYVDNDWWLTYDEFWEWFVEGYGSIDETFEQTKHGVTVFGYYGRS